MLITFRHLILLINNVNSSVKSSVCLDTKMVEEEVVEQIHDKLDADSDPKLQHEGYDGECDDGKSEPGKSELATDAASALDLSKSNKWVAFLKGVKPVSPILLDKFPSMSLRYKSIINELKSAICDLPHSKDQLPTYIKICEIAIESLHKEKEKNLWGNYPNSVAFKHLGDSLKFLLSNMKSIEFKFDLEISTSGDKYANRPSIKETDINPNFPEIKKDKDEVDQPQNRWIEILTEVPPIAPILLKMFPTETRKYKLTIECCTRTIKTLPYSRYQLPLYIRWCKADFVSLRKQIKRRSWGDIENLTAELQQLEDSLNFLFSKMMSIAIELKVDCVYTRYRNK